MAREAVAVDFLGILAARASLEKQQQNITASAKLEPVFVAEEKAAGGVGAAAMAMATTTKRKSDVVDKAEERQRSISRLRQLGEHINLKAMQQLPSWNRPEIVQQGAPRSSEEESSTIGLKTKEAVANGLMRSPALRPSPGLAHSSSSTTESPSSSSPMGWFHMALQQNCKRMPLSTNNFLSPRTVHNAAAQASAYRGDEPHRDAQSSERAGSESPLSLVIPDTESQPAAAAAAVQGTGFGSPLPVHFSEGLESEAAVDNQQVHQMQHPMMQCGNMQSATLPRPAQVGGAGVHQPTAQLTLFYAGVVHVYDDITLDKVQAIMLLASGSATWPSGCKNPLSGNGVPTRPFPSPIPQSTPSSSVSPPQATTTTATAAASSVPTLPTIHANVLPRSIARSVHVVTELPQARKASLARFLEKRKDRVRVKAPYLIKKEGSSTPPRDKSPSPSCKSPSPPCSRPMMCLPSSALLRWTRYRQDVPSANTRDPQYYYSSSSGSEPNSPTRAPSTPPRPSMAGDNLISGSFRGWDFETESDFMVRQRQNFLSKFLQDHRGEEPMEEDSR